MTCFLVGANPRAEFAVLPVSRRAFSCNDERRCYKLLRSSLRRIEAKFRPAPLRVSLGFAPALLVRRFKRSQATDFLKNTFGVQLVFQPFEGAVDWLTFANDNFWHGSSFGLKNVSGSTGEAEPTRAGEGRQLL
jgi:hypothetical protein